MCRDNAAAAPEIECWYNVVYIGRFLRFLSQSFNMGCFGSKTIPNEVQFGPSISVDYEELRYLRGKVQLQDREICFLESRLEAQSDIASSWQEKFWRLKRSELAMDARS